MTERTQTELLWPSEDFRLLVSSSLMLNLWWQEWKEKSSPHNEDYSLNERESHLLPGSKTFVTFFFFEEILTQSPIEKVCRRVSHVNSLADAFLAFPLHILRWQHRGQSAMKLSVWHNRASRGVRKPGEQDPWSLLLFSHNELKTESNLGHRQREEEHQKDQEPLLVHTLLVISSLNSLT